MKIALEPDPQYPSRRSVQLDRVPQTGPRFRGQGSTQFAVAVAFESVIQSLVARSFEIRRSIVVYTVGNAVPDANSNRHSESKAWRLIIRKGFFRDKIIKA